ncbi:MAG: hypothetical protein DLM70_11150, partial [Chloroflexi bacterium]
AVSSPVRIRTNAKLGRILTSSRGMTLYYFKVDRRGGSACTGPCSHTWRPLVASRSSVAAKNDLRGRLSVIRRSDGRRQVTYRGWPLYTFIGDRKPGDAFGRGILGQWFVATPSLAARTRHTPPVASPKPAPAPTRMSPTYPPPASTPPPVNCIPGNNGGDMDGDNNSEPSDGDGCQ